MNFIFISPQFPKTYWNFCDRLKNKGVCVLGIGDTPYDELDDHVKNSLQEYYRVDNMENYEEQILISPADIRIKKSWKSEANQK